MKKNWLKNWLVRKSPGETLLEVIVALLVITMGAATATSLILTAIRANVFNKDSLIALNLAQEGLEYMRNLRDSNWISYSADTQDCWNMKTSTGSCVTPFPDLIAEANPTAIYGGYSLGTSLSDPIALALDLSDGINGNDINYLISYWDTNSGSDSDGDTIATNDKDIMASAPVTGTGVVTQGLATKYYRSIEVKYYTIGPAPTWALTLPATPQTADLMMVTSKVQWLDGTTAHVVSLSSALSRYK